MCVWGTTPELLALTLVGGRRLISRSDGQRGILWNELLNQFDMTVSCLKVDTISEEW
jgi:hypothetical protein